MGCLFVMFGAFPNLGAAAWTNREKVGWRDA
jgi:hypothetical protein